MTTQYESKAQYIERELVELMHGFAEHQDKHACRVPLRPVGLSYIEESPEPTFWDTADGFAEISANDVIKFFIGNYSKIFDTHTNVLREAEAFNQWMVGIFEIKFGGVELIPWYYQLAYRDRFQRFIDACREQSLPTSHAYNEQNYTTDLHLDFLYKQLHQTKDRVRELEAENAKLKEKLGNGELKDMVYEKL